MIIDAESFAAMLARSLHKAPHGTELPERMPYVGDIFVKEEADETSTVYVWNGQWVLGASGLKKVDGCYAPQQTQG